MDSRQICYIEHFLINNFKRCLFIALNICALATQFQIFEISNWHFTVHPGESKIFYEDQGLFHPPKCCLTVFEGTGTRTMKTYLY
jgi:hypothetical protein